MQNGRFNFNNAMNFHPSHQQFDRFPSQNPPIYTTFGFEPRHSYQLHQPPISPINRPPPYSYGGCSESEQRLRDEVIYLHSLWRRGPPQFQNPHLKPLPTSPQIQTLHLRPSSTTSRIQNPHLKSLPTTPFKKKKKNKKKKPNKPQVVSDKEWPVDPKAACPSPPRQGWGEFKPRSSPISRPATAEEQERALAVRVQLKGLDSCIGSFHNSDDDDDDDDEDEEDYDEEEAFERFVKVFEDDEKLREYYKTKCENGEFYCLVCGVIANKLGRKYKDCVALVQHSVSISKTKKRIAHRAYGRVVCRVLGWDIDRLPSLPSTIVEANAVIEPQSSEKSSESAQVEIKKNVDGSEDKPTVVNGEAELANTTASQAEPDCILDVVQKDNANRKDDEFIANDRRDAVVNLPPQCNH